MTKPASSPRLSLTLTLLVAALFVIVLDFSRVQIALPTLRTELGISLANSQWIVSATRLMMSLTSMVLFTRTGYDDYEQEWTQ